MRYGPAELQNELSRRTGKRVQLYLTDNRRRMVSARNLGDGVVEVRLQRVFLDSDSEVLDEIALLLAGRPTDRPAIRGFIDQRFRDAPPPARQREPGGERQTSRHHDIAAYARELNAAYLGGRSTARVVWGRKSTRRSARSIRFACYDPERNLVIMNRKLDNERIPAFFVEYVLFHEMLHEVLGIGERDDGRRDIHGSLFKLMESTFPDFDKARRYEKELCKHLGSL